MKYTIINNPYEIAIGDYILGYKITKIDYSAAGYVYAEKSGGLKTTLPWEFVNYLTNNGEVVRETEEPKPTVMPDWMEKQFDKAERTVATWSDGKCEAAGIPREKNKMNIKLEVYHDTELWDIVNSVNACLQGAGVDIEFATTWCRRRR